MVLDFLYAFSMKKESNKMFLVKHILVYSSREASESGPKAQTRKRSKARFIKSRVKNTSVYTQTKFIRTKFVPGDSHAFRAKLTDLTRRISIEHADKIYSCPLRTGKFARFSCKIDGSP